jgi:signal transduction histidine kinase
MTSGSYDIRLAHASAEADADDRTRLLLEQALADVQAGLGELRELAHGIYPAILTEAGLGPALATLADSASIPVELGDAATGNEKSSGSWPKACRTVRSPPGCS